MKKRGGGALIGPQLGFEKLQILFSRLTPRGVWCNMRHNASVELGLTCRSTRPDEEIVTTHPVAYVQHRIEREFAQGKVARNDAPDVKRGIHKLRREGVYYGM